MFEYLSQFMGDPWMAFFSLIIMSYILEDLAIVTAALLSAQHQVSPSIALMAIFIGISTGDLALYFLGYLAKKLRCLRYWLLKKPKVKQVKRKLQTKTFSNILTIRFIPGLRTISYSLCGFLGISIWRFMLAVVIATSIWSGIIFGLIYYLGSASWVVDTHWKWILAPLAIGTLVWINRSGNKLCNRVYK